VSAASDLLSNYQNVITDLRFVMGDRSVFDVTVDGNLIYSKAETGRHAEDGEVLALFADLMGPDIPRYGEE
jgi:selenoprotein W-related protein